MKNQLKCLVKRACEMVTMRRMIFFLLAVETALLVASAEEITDSLTQLYVDRAVRIERMNAAHVSADTHREAIKVDQAVWLQNSRERDIFNGRIKDLEGIREETGKNYQVIDDLYYLPEQSAGGALGEYPLATPTIKNFIKIIVANEKITVTDIYRQGSPSAHKAGAAVDIRLKNLPDRQGAFDWLNRVDALGVVCEIHRNLDINNEWGDAQNGYLGGINAGNSHVHCNDKYWLEQQAELRNPKVNIPPEEKISEKLLDAIATCEKSDPDKNRYGLMCWDGEPRHLCVLTEEEAREMVMETLGRYADKNPGITLATAVYIYAPPGENNVGNHTYCISENSGIPSNTPLESILRNEKL